MPAPPLRPGSPLSPSSPGSPLSPVNPLGPVRPGGPCSPFWPGTRKGHSLHESPCGPGIERIVKFVWKEGCNVNFSFHRH